MSSILPQRSKLSFPLILLGSMLFLTGCGIKGSLQTPPPLWGEDRRTAQGEAAGDSILDESPLENEDGDLFDDDDDFFEDDEDFEETTIEGAPF